MAFYRNLVFTLCCMVGLFLSSPYCIAADIRVVSATSKLLQYKENEQLKGPSAEIFKLLMADAKLPISLDFMPWSRAYKIASAQANTLIFTMLRTAEREDKFYWLLQVTESQRVFVSLKSRPDLNSISFDQAKTKLVAVIRDSFSLTSLIKDGFSESDNLYVVTDMKTAISLFINGKVDLLYADPSVLKNYFAAKGQNSEEMVTYHTFSETQHGGYIALNKQSAPELVKRLQLSAQHVKNNPLYKYYYYLEPLIN